MPTSQVEYRTEEERLLLQKALAFFAEMHAMAQTAPAGQVIVLCADHARGGPREPVALARCPGS